jgi:pyruvate dehydrogenase E2 component (dihydrolipoamide acetyltransferase)
MATIIRMPEVLANVTEAAIQGWLVAVGDTIVVGQPLAEIETEKAMVEYNAEVAGVVVRLLVEPGANVDVGVPIGVIGAAGETDADIDRLLAGSGVEVAAPVVAVDEPADLATATNAAPGVVPAGAESSASPSAPADASHGDRQFASPLVRRLVKERLLDLVGVVGSGPGGRIVRRDIENLATAPEPAAPEPVAPESVTPAPALPEPVAAPAAKPAPAASTSATGFTDFPLTGMRKAIARRLTESKSTVPHFYIVADVRVDKLMALRRDVNAASSRKVSVNDFVVKAVAAALLDVPAANAIWADTAIRQFDSVDLAVAVSTEGGLLTPVLRGVEKLSLTAISEQIADLATRARAGKLRQNELEGGSFAVSNLGMYGVDEFSAILNPPQSGILAVGAAKQRPVVDDGELAVGTVMTVTLSADHRVVDGAVGAEWLQAFVKRVENPLSLLI